MNLLPKIVSIKEPPAQASSPEEDAIWKKMMMTALGKAIDQASIDQVQAKSVSQRRRAEAIERRAIKTIDRLMNGEKPHRAWAYFQGTLKETGEEIQMNLLKEIDQAKLTSVDGSDAGTTDVADKAKDDISFSLMRNTINSDGKVSATDVADYLERAADLNDEVDTVLYGLETSDGQVVKVYVNAMQAEAFEKEMKKMLGMEDDIEDAINALASKFDIVDVIWPKEEKEEGEDEDELSLDDAADLGDDDDLEVIASVDNQEEDGDEDGEGEEELPPPPEDVAAEEEPKAEKPAEEEPVEEPAPEEEEEEPKAEKPAEEEPAPEEEEEEEEEEEKPAKGKKAEKKSSYNLLRQIGNSWAGKGEVAEGQVINVNFGKSKDDDKNSDAPAAKKMSLLKSFGSEEMQDADDVGVKLTEKPSYWEDFDADGFAAKRNINELKLKRLEKTVGKLKEYSGKEIYGSDMKPRGPQATVKKMPSENMFIVHFSDGTRYVADQRGARTYIRNWQKIN